LNFCFFWSSFLQFIRMGWLVVVREVIGKVFLLMYWGMFMPAAFKEKHPMATIFAYGLIMTSCELVRLCHWAVIKWFKLDVSRHVAATEACVDFTKFLAAAVLLATNPLGRGYAGAMSPNGFVAMAAVSAVDSVFLLMYFTYVRAIPMGWDLMAYYVSREKKNVFP
jgi:hypothetical protein